MSDLEQACPRCGMTNSVRDYDPDGGFLWHCFNCSEEWSCPDKNEPSQEKIPTKVESEPMPRYQVMFQVTMDLVRWANGENEEEAWADLVRVQGERVRRENAPTTYVKLDCLKMYKVDLKKRIPANAIYWDDEHNAWVDTQGRLIAKGKREFEGKKGF